MNATRRHHLKQLAALGLGAASAGVAMAQLEASGAPWAWDGLPRALVGARRRRLSEARQDGAAVPNYQAA